MTTGNAGLASHSVKGAYEMLLLSLKFKTGVCLRAGQRRCKRGNVRIHGVVAAVPGGFGRFSSAPEDGCHHTADLAAPLRKILTSGQMA